VAIAEVPFKKRSWKVSPHHLLFILLHLWVILFGRGLLGFVGVKKRIK
jgi:hypothetical protein